MTVTLLFFRFLFEKMSKYITVIIINSYYNNYYTESEFAKEPHQATEDSAGYDLLAAETKTLPPKTVDTLSLELRWAIPTGFYGKLFVRSGILKEDFVSIDAGVINADFRGISLENTFTVRTGDKIGQVIFMEKFNANFHRVSEKHLFGKTKCGNDGFGSTGVTVIKKVKKDDDDDDDDDDNDDDDKGIESTTSENHQVIVNSEEDVQIIPEKSKNEWQITSEEAIMTVDNEVVVHE